LAPAETAAPGQDYGWLCFKTTTSDSALSRPDEHPLRSENMSLANTMHELLQPLLAAQRYAVLATDHGGQPYTSLMAFAASQDLRDLTLVTERATQKYANLTANSRVAVFIDNRENVGADTHEAVAVTAIGAAQEVTGDDCTRLRAAYILRHPYLAEFASSPSCAIVRVSVKSYVVVRRFEEVLEWRLGE